MTFPIYLIIDRTVKLQSLHLCGVVFGYELIICVAFSVKKIDTTYTVIGSDTSFVVEEQYFYVENPEDKVYDYECR